LIRLSADAGLPIEDEVFLKDGDLLKVGRDRGSMGFFPPLAMLFFLVCLSRRSVFRLRHPGMIAPFLSDEKPPDFGAAPLGAAACWSIAFRLKRPGGASLANRLKAFNAEPLLRINSSSQTSSPQPNHFDCAPGRPFTGSHWLETPCLKLLQQFF
jgi:hypothetical protein